MHSHRSIETDRAEPTRRDLVDAAVRDVGKIWVAHWLAELVRQSRPAAGGWPGTLREARGRISAHVDPVLARHRMRAMSMDELSDAARATYRRARREWLAAPALERESAY